MFADYHVHTQFSDDSVYPMEQVAQGAIALGMDEICFTDHVDYGIKQDWDCGHPIHSIGEKNRWPMWIIRSMLKMSGNYRKNTKRKFA